MIRLGLGTSAVFAGSSVPSAPYVETRSVVTDGIDDYLDVGTPAALSGVDQHFTASCWFKTEVNSPCDLFSKWEGLGNRDWVIYMTGGVVYAYMNTSTGPVGAASAAPYNDNAWHLATISWNGVSLAVDIDGGLERVTSAAADRLGTAGSSVFLSARDDGAGGALSFYFGNLDEISFFDAALTAGQCTELFNAGVPMDLASHTAFADLVSWWRAGDYPGDSTDSGDPAARIYDAKGSNDATPVNMDIGDVVYDVPPTFNRLSLLTDGVDEYAELAGGSVTGCEFNFNQPWSVSAWMKTTQDTTGGAGYIASKIQGAPHYTGWAVGIYNYNPFCFFSHSVSFGVYAQSYIGQFASTGAWKHVVWTYDGSGTLAGGMQMYVNGTNVYPAGQVVTSYIDTIGGNSTLGGATAPLRIGAASYGEFFDGNFDEVSIWSKELSGADVSTIYNNGTPKSLTGMTDLDAWYRCGEAPGDSATGTIFDLSGNSNDLAATNMEVADIQTVTPRPFWNLLSLGFDGVDERLYSSPAGNCPIYDRNDTFSVSLWMKSSAATWQCMIGKQIGSGNYRGWGIFQNPTAGGKFFVAMFSTLGSNTQGVRTQVGGFNDGNWHHVCMTYSGSSTAAGILIYVDGVSEPLDIDSDTLTSTIANSTAMSIGSRGLANAFYNGRIDEVSLYNTTLSAANVTEIYNNGMPRDVKTLTTSGDLDAYYRCGDNTFDAKALGQATVFDKTANVYDLWQANMEQSDFAEDTP